MSIATMTDRSLPLAERVSAMGLLDWDKDNADGRWDARDALLADVAAAERLAEAVDKFAAPAPFPVHDWMPRHAAYMEALAAYRARKEVARG